MKFELKPDNRNSSDEDLIKDLKEVAQSLSKNTLTRSEYGRRGRYSGATLSKRFGSWNEALKKGGLVASYSTPDYSFISDEQLITELKRISAIPNVEAVTVSAFNKHKIIPGTAARIQSRFGTWANALKKAELDKAPSGRRFTDDDLFENMLNVWTYHGRQPTVTEMGEFPSEVTRNTYSNRFSSWRNTLEQFVIRMNKEENLDQRVLKTGPSANKLQEVKKQITVSEDRRGIPLGLRYKVLSRDNFKCVRCGRNPATNIGVELHIDHKLPFSLGGKTVLENLETKCKECNLGKSNRHSE